MELCELGEPEREFYVYSEGIGLGEPFICERAGGDGFLKWIVQPAEFVRNDWWEDGYYYYDEAKVHFTGKRIDGTVFASTREDDLPARFIIGKDDVMQGFSMAVSSMQEGEKAVFIIPPELALTKFGRPASFPGNIPLNQALRFDIELISLVIVTDIRGDEGILKKNIKRGMGDGKPRDLDEVIVNYNACMEDGVSVSMSERVEFKLAEGFFCPAFAIAVETMTEGEEAVFIVKPEYGFEPFGEQGRPSIGNETAVPPGATLYVYLKLISFTTVNHIGEGHTVLIKRTLRRGNSKEHPENQAEVGVRLIGKLQDGVIFDHRGHEGDEPFKFIVDEEQVSDALEEAILTMREGEIASFTIPPQRLQNQLVVIPSGSSVTYEIELVSVVNETEPESLSRAECIETAFRKEKEGDNLFSSNKMLRAYRRYWKAMFIIRPYIEIIKREVAEGTEQEIYQEPVEEETEEEKIDEETDGEEIYEEPVEEIDEEPVQEDLDEGTEKEDIDIGTDEEEIYRKYIYEEEIDEEIKQMFVSFSFKAAECATQLQCYELAKGCYYEILRYDPENVKAQQLAGQPFPEDSVGIDNAAVHRGLWEPKPMKAPPQRRLKQGRHKPQNLIDVPPIKRPDANVPTGDSPATRATSDVNTSRVTTSNENQSSGTITARGRPTGLSSDCALDKLNLTEDKSEKGTK